MRVSQGSLSMHTCGLLKSTKARHDGCWETQRLPTRSTANMRSKAQYGGAVVSWWLVRPSTDEGRSENQAAANSTREKDVAMRWWGMAFASGISMSSAFAGFFQGEARQHVHDSWRPPTVKNCFLAEAAHHITRCKTGGIPAVQPSFFR